MIILSALGVIFAKKPVHSCLAFLLTLFGLAALFVELSAPFIAVMQILVYAGAILVIFMFVIVLFQDAYLAIEEYKAKVKPLWLLFAGITFAITLFFVGRQFSVMNAGDNVEFGSVQAIARTLYLDFFFPFEAVGLLFLVAIVGALYVGKKVK